MERSSQILQSFLNLPKEQKMTIGQFLELFGVRSIAIVILILALPHSIPIVEPPGISTITGLPILFFSFQIMIGRHKIWLPKKLTEKKLPQTFLRKAIKYTLPVIKFIEKFIHPRWKCFFSKNAQKFIGFMIFLMSLVLALPIPGANFLPGVSISLLALALIETDGVLAAIAIIFSTASLVLMYKLILFTIKVILSWIKGFIHSGP